MQDYQNNHFGLSRSTQMCGTTGTIISVCHGARKMWMLDKLLLCRSACRATKSARTTKMVVSCEKWFRRRSQHMGYEIANAEPESLCRSLCSQFIFLFSSLLLI